ncbi:MULTISPECIES: hypothetical protein [Methanoculleus]|uniref:Restriction endonuclease type IV Mrr domain-containing protein n=2 Tax=Methanoculleus TaxID=45989 RepID=A3CVM1_METMJ|nr:MULTISPECIES: hypothetical protein [Methanoculleus]ABN57421.1 conserved hypothetical protein [Methanoculleus marisnigri JR1]UYU18826.1 hypothetical protein OH143_01670 [Methanoculleus submarinus]
MERIEFDRAYYIKLGERGKWEQSSIEEGKMRIGWTNVDLEDILRGNWETIERAIRYKVKNTGSATHDFNSLKTIHNSNHGDVWITFYDSKFWWCRLEDGPILEDEVSKYRLADGGWHDRNIQGKVLLTNTLPGNIAQLQAYRATSCTVRPFDTLRRLINGEHTSEFIAVVDAREELVCRTEALIRHLHWKDFEVLVDLVFSGAGWRRRSVVGETMKFADIEFEDTINAESYQVQVKSRSSLDEFCEYSGRFNRDEFRKLFYVVHSPDDALAAHEVPPDSGVVLVPPRRLSAMVVDAGLVGWVLEKTI